MGHVHTDDARRYDLSTVRDASAIDGILQALRDLWQQSPGVTLGMLIWSAMEPAAVREIGEVSDEVLLRNLRAMRYFASRRRGATAANAIGADHLAALDQARDYNAASSYNWLRAELERFRALVRGGAEVRVEEGAGGVVFGSLEDFEAWARGRYPGV
jgi:hypothetical protein